VFNYDQLRGITILGSNRVSSSVKICGPAASASPQPLPALGIMHHGGQIMYFYVPTGVNNLCYGDETAWLNNDSTNQMGTTGTTGSGSLGNRRDGRTTFGNDDDSEALVIESGGKSGAVIFASGDHATGVALYIDATMAPKFDLASTWYTYANS